MDIKFKKSGFPYMKQVIGEIQNMEQTQEIKLTDGMPDIDRVVGAWGQTILRSKEWRSDSVLFSGGLMVWALYLAEDGSGLRVLDSWIPFQMKWELPEDCDEGRIRVHCMTRFVDARSVSPRKIMIRAGVTAMGEAYVAQEAAVFEPEEELTDVELLRTRYPIQLPKEAGETSFLLEEDVELDSTGNGVQRLVYYTVQPEITDKKVLGNKTAFRGNGNLHVLYENGDGMLESRDILLPFSQFAEVETVYGSEAEASIQLCVTNLEMELGESGQGHLRCGVVAQYVILDRQMVETVEDAYSPGRAMELHQELLELPAQLELRRENLVGEQSLTVPLRDPVDTSLFLDYPRPQQHGEMTELLSVGTVQFLYYGDQGALQTASVRMESRGTWNGDAENRLSIMPLHAPYPMLSTSGGRTGVKLEMPVEITCVAGRGIPIVSGMELGTAAEPDAGRPSLILKRAGGQRLWNLAKECGSTVSAIQDANHLDGEPTPNQLLLIPVS